MQIADRWLRDIPQQFLGKHNIEVLIRAFARQLQELQEVFDDLNTQLDIERAEGKNLDYVGTIVPLSRKEAGELAGIGVTEPVISDERYRRFMQYKILRNTSECTYYDLVAGIEMLWQYENIHYIEDPKHPAMIIFETPMLSLDEADPVEFHANLCIRASGIGVMLRKIYGADFPVKIKGEAAAVTFIMAFYPLFNLPKLQLNARWKLNGKKKLNGYDSSGKTDLYPVEMEIQVPVHEVPGEAAQIGFLLGAQEQTESGQEMEVLILAAGKTDVKEEFALQTSAKTDIKAGNATLYNAHRLDGKRKLNGSRKLNGGIYEL